MFWLLQCSIRQNTSYKSRNPYVSSKISYTYMFDQFMRKHSVYPLHNLNLHGKKILNRKYFVSLKLDSIKNFIVKEGCPTSEAANDVRVTDIVWQYFFMKLNISKNIMTIFWNMSSVPRNKNTGWLSNVTLHSMMFFNSPILFVCCFILSIYFCLAVFWTFVILTKKIIIWRIEHPIDNPMLLSSFSTKSILWKAN